MQRITWNYIQYNSGGSNIDGSFTTAISNSFFSPLEKKHVAADLENFRVKFFFI